MGKKGIANMISEEIENTMLRLRGQRVMLDSDLARLYGIETGALLRALRRNLQKLPVKSKFQLTAREYEHVMSRRVASPHGGGRRRKSRPYAFTELGLVSLAKILQSRQAIRANIRILRTFAWLRRREAVERRLALRFQKMGKKRGPQLWVVYDALRELTEAVGGGRRLVAIRVEGD